MRGNSHARFLGGRARVTASGYPAAAMGNESGAWVDEEFESLDLGDPRRDRRAKDLLKRFAALPTASIPGACDDWSQTIGAYRFLGNEQIDWRDVMQPHWERTAERVAQFPVVLCIADTTELNFNGQEMEGLGPLSYEAQRGMFLHVRRESRRIRCFPAEVSGRKPGVPSPVVYRCMRGW